ncbi:unnamed protein product [Bursaphelenchus xylophilus]|uniref:(pine wood nematode) hypothetical protein n=1 Tax=Bursaphelenchus xylophilus TaxID=6326 RepID=A0A1I7SWI8_BURXY|nr:unnamed protein product [Bursaphelenchus xylophilus]CAG9099476.1 unnamed protein product [Bursaphelenchus xylophilus]
MANEPSCPRPGGFRESPFRAKDDVGHGPVRERRPGMREETGPTVMAGSWESPEHGRRGMSEAGGPESHPLT